MKRFALCVTLTCMAWFAIFNSSAQGIEIDSTFSTFCEIYPFESIESISSLTIEGDISLNNDTSLARVIVEDVSGFQYMVLEAYPLICEDLDFSVKDYCDETCALEQCKPISVIIQIIDAELKIDYLSYETDPKENPAESRYQAKRAKDEEKIDIMNERIPEFQMNWTSGDNSLVASYYDQKRKMFGDGYNLLGYDYYSDGVFEFLGHQDYPKVDPDLVRHFDWRERHGANDSLSPYWDGDTLGTGWLTYSKNQGISCNSCWTFSSLGTLEAIANLFTTDHIDYNLSEQDLLSCSRAGDCEGGDVDTALRYILYHDVVTEECFPYQAQDYTMLPCTTELKCSTPDSTLRMDGIKFYPYNSVYFKEDSLRVKLIEKGPLVFNFEVEPLKYHSVVLVGFYLQPDSTLYWVIKESKNPDWGENGFGKIMLESYISAYAVIPPIYQNGDTLPTTCIDKDGDGYYFWGIGDKPDTCDCLDIEDCNDNDSLVGGYDEKYNCTCLLEMDSLAHHVRTNVTWEDTIYVNYEVIIDSGACLTIRGYTAFAPEAMVLVKPGGKLILDSAYLTKACPELWDGIEVRGSDRSQFYDEYFGVVEV